MSKLEELKQQYLSRKSEFMYKYSYQEHSSEKKEGSNNISQFKEDAYEEEKGEHQELMEPEQEDSIREERPPLANYEEEKVELNKVQEEAEKNFEEQIAI